MQAKRVAVIGASGFIGSHLTELLVKEGAEVLAVARSLRRLARLSEIADCRVCSADIQDREAIGAALHRFRPETVFHLASNTDAAESFQQMAGSLEANAIGTTNLLEAAARAGAGLFVYGDSCKVYGNGPVPYRCEQADAPVCSYAVGKAAGWRLCLVAGAFTGMNVCGLRPTFAYGPRQSRNLISYVEECVRRGDPVRLMGGAQTRDPIYVEDLARAFVCAATQPGARGCVVPVGGGEEIGVAVLSRRIVRMLGSDVEVVADAEAPRPTETWRSWCDNSDARALLGWAPAVSLEQGLRRTLGAAARFRERLSEVGESV